MIQRPKILIIAGILLTALWLWQVHSYLNVANDAGRYMVLGKSLATDGDYRLINEPLRQRDTLYPPGFPLLIAAWLKLTGREPGGIVLLVKASQLVFLLVSLPLLARLLKKARCRPLTVSAGVLIAGLSPAYASYANEIMSEAPFLLLCLTSLVLVERDVREEISAPTDEAETDSQAKVSLSPHGERVGVRGEIPNWARILSLLFAALSFMIRSAGIALMLVQCVWFWKRFGAKWGVAAIVVMLTVVGSWQVRSRQVMRTAPKGARYTSYSDQFFYRDPMRPGSGRIPRNLTGLAIRVKDGFPAYMGMTPRALLHSMSRFSSWAIVFYILAIPLGAAMFAGMILTWKRGLWLSSGFGLVFWIFAAMWPWRDPRFLFPLLPFLILFALVTLETLDDLFAKSSALKVYRAILGVMAALLAVYFLQVHLTIVRAEKRPIVAGYAFGRSKPESGFYAACAWLKQNTPPEARVMGRPAYLLSLYSERIATQIEPTTNPDVMEKGTLQNYKLDYILADSWSWANSKTYLAPYFAKYGERWRLAWKDKQSGVKVWQRVMPYNQSTLDGTTGFSGH